jgi:hypothetical protein
VKFVEINSERSEVVQRRLSQIFGQQFEQNHHSHQMADHFALRVSICSSISEHPAPLS